MINIKPQFITNEKGEKISVVIPIKDFESLIDKLSENEVVKIADKERKAWLSFSKQEFAKLYENEEPDYNDVALKEPNTNYKKS